MGARDSNGLMGDVLAARLLDRRLLLRWGLGLAVLPLVRCGGSDSAAAGSDAGSSGTCSTIPEETAGPYPGDGSNGANVLTQSGIVRGDIRTSFGSASADPGGVNLTITLTLQNKNASCAALPGYAVYLWHCDRNGSYSLYSSGVTTQNYLRGVQQTDSNGRVTFQSYFPGCYSGRWPHIHFEVYPSLALATAAGNKVATSQLALPKSTCDQVYADSRYPNSASNLAQVTLASDNVFADGSSTQVATVAGSNAAGYTCELAVPIAR